MKAEQTGITIEEALEQARKDAVYLRAGIERAITDLEAGRRTVALDGLRATLSLGSDTW